MNKIEDAINDLNIYESKGFKKLNFQPIELENLKSLVKHLLAGKKRDEASELIVERLKISNKFVALRDDERKELWIYQLGIYVPNGGTYLQEFCRIIMEDLYTSHFSNTIIDKIRADSYVEHENFFGVINKEEIAVENGILNLYTKKLLPFDSNKIFFQKIPVKFDKTKTCPNITTFLNDILEDKSDFQVIKELFGDLLHKEYKFERCFMFLGEGRNGKSKLGELMKRFLGAKSICSVHPSSLEDPDSFNISSFFGKLANISLDVNSTALKNISIIKSLSGRDLLTAPRKFKTPLEFENYAKLIFGANQLPITFDTKDSFWERWILIQFPYTFVSENVYKKLDHKQKKNKKLRDPDIIKKLIVPHEMSGLLNMALEGFQSLISNKGYSYKFTPEEVKSIWIMKSDSFSAFWIKYFEHDYDSKVRKSDMRRYYAEFCRSNKVKPMSDKMIKRKLIEEGVSDDDTRIDGKYESHWVGLKVKAEFEERDEFSFSQMKKYNSQRALSFVKKLIDSKPKVEEVNIQEII